MKRRALDVSKLADVAFGARDPMWWGVMLLIAIEGTMLALLAVSYVYVADRTDPFPPTHMGRDVAVIATIDMLLWVIACIPQRLNSKAAIAGSVRGMRLWLTLGTALLLAATVMRFWLFAELPFRWDDHAYGSVVWGLLALHLLHGVTGFGEDAVYVVLLITGPVEEKHRTDIEVSSPLVYFVAIGAVVVWALVFAELLFRGAA